MNIEELQLLMKELAQPSYRAVQVFEWLHQRFPNSDDGAFSFEAMYNLPKDLRAALEERCYITPVSIADKLTAKDGTVKYLLALGKSPEVHIESVLMEYTHGRSVCVSTQAGCRMGCLFCATAHGGLLRNLTPGEMCMQVYTAAAGQLLPTEKHVKLVAPAVKRAIRNVVIMGCGEPLDNFDATMRFIELITHPKGIGLSQRHITLSTCGLVPKILELAQRRMQITLAVSLHGPDDVTRQALMPTAKAYPIKTLIAACKEYTDITHRRITYEYALMKDINDSPAQARALAGLLKGHLCHVNLIPVNPVSVDGASGFAPTDVRGVNAFAEILAQARITSTIRRTVGAEVNAACGQLRSRKV